MNNFYSFEPVDTLFFRGAEPMNMGENHSSNMIFPPPAHTIEGALRTYLFRLNKDKYADLIKVGEEKGGFNVIGPFFMEDKELFIPAPYSWFVEKKSDENEQIKPGFMKIYKSKIIKTDLIVSRSQDNYWAKSDKGEIVSLGANWIKLEDLYTEKDNLVVKSCEDFFVKENRVGIALDPSRKVREGHIYSFTHARLKKNVKIVFALDKELPIDDTGILTLGAEQRFGRYEKLKTIFKIKEKGQSYMNLSVLSSCEIKKEDIIATGKPQYLGGWDLSKGFHKPMKSYYPVGSVFSSKINKNFIAI